MVKAASMSTLNHDENEVILRNGSQESVKLALVKHARFNENDDISGNKICHMGQLKDRGCLNCKRNSMKIKGLNMYNLCRQSAVLTP